MATSQQQLQLEQHNQQVLQQEGKSVKQQLEDAQAESLTAKGALEQAQALLRKLLVQVSVIYDCPCGPSYIRGWCCRPA